MKNRVISLAIGCFLILGTGLFVYVTKQASVLPSETSGLNQNNTEQTPVTTQTQQPVQQTSGEYEDDDEGGSTSPVVTTPTTPAPTPTTQTQPSGITLSQVASHNSRSNCWSAINGNVYDLTSWIPNHPGGEQTILSICGIDGSGAYNGQHGGRSKPAAILVGFKIGALAK